MGACENSFEAHEPSLNLAATEQHSFLKFIKDSDQLPALQTGQSLIDSNMDPTSATDACLELCQDENAGWTSVGGEIEAGLADKEIELASENFVGSVAGKFLEDECGVGGACLNERLSRIDDCNGETDGFQKEKVGVGGENGGSGACNRCLKSVVVSGPQGNCDQQDGWIDDKNVDVQGVMEEQTDEIVPSTCCKTSIESIQINDLHGNCVQQANLNDDNGPVVQGVMEENFVGLAPIEANADHEIVLSSSCKMPAELIPANGLASDGIEQYKHDCNTFQEVAVEEKNGEAGSEISNRHGLMEWKSDSSAATETAYACEKILPTFHEIPAESLPVTCSLRNGVEQVKEEGHTFLVVAMEEKRNDLAGIESISGQVVVEEKCDGFATIENCICNTPLPGWEMLAGLIPVNVAEENGISPKVVAEERSFHSTSLKIDNQSQMLSSQDHGTLPEATPLTCPPSKHIQQDDQHSDLIISHPFAGGIMWETSNVSDATETTTPNQLLPSHGLEKTLKVMPMTISPEEIALHKERKILNELDAKAVGGLVIEMVQEQGSNTSARIEADMCTPISADGTIDSRSTGDLTGEMDSEGKDHASVDCVSETRCHAFVSSSRRGKVVRKPSRKTQTKKAARECRNTSKLPNLHGGIEIFFKGVTRKRSCVPKKARTSAWGLLENISQTCTLIPDLGLDDMKNHGSQQIRVGRGSRMQNNKHAGGSSRRSSRKGCASASCIRLKVKVGKEICQTESNLKIMIPEVIDTKVSTDLIDDCGAESHQGTGFEISKLAPCAEDRKGEEGTEKQLLSFDCKLGKEKAHRDAAFMDANLANKDMEGAVISDKLSGDFVDDFLGVPPYTEIEALGVATEKRYTDPGTSPDSEVINLIPEGQVTATCQGEFSDATLSSSKDFTAREGGTGGRRGKKKERLPQAGNSDKVKLGKKRGGRQRKGNGLSSSEILTSSNSANGSLNISCSKEYSMEQAPFTGKTELGVSEEAFREEISMNTKICGGQNAELRLSELQVSKNLLTTKSRGCKFERKSDGVNKGRSDVYDAAKCRRANDKKSNKKTKVKEKTLCGHVDCKDEDDAKTDDNGKNDAGYDITEAEVANSDIPSTGSMEQNLSPDNAWVRCDECLKWRRIPVGLVESISQTHCQWICKDNLDNPFAHCSIPQEKSNAEINAELGISDADEDPCDAPSYYMESACRNTSASKEYEFTHIGTNQFLHRSRKTQTIDEIMVCHCKAPLDGRLGCGDECLNRMLNIECVQGTCPCGDLCSNQQFQKQNYAKMKWERCGKKGYGLLLEEDISRGQFLIEYVGEVLDVHAYEARQKEYASKGRKHFYFMTLDGSEVIDACAKGNLGRFINHSCDPNCRTEKWVVNGEICIGLFALRDINKGEELTFDYNYVRVFGAAAKKCYCCSPLCRGYIGGDPTNSEVIDHVDSDEEFPEPVMLEAEEAGDDSKDKIFIEDSCMEYKPAVGTLVVATEIKDSLNQTTPAISQPCSAMKMIDLPIKFSSSSQQPAEISPQADNAATKSLSAVKQEISMEETVNKSSSQKSKSSLSSGPTKPSPDDIVNRKLKSTPAENKRVFVKSRFFIKTSHQSGLIKKGKSINDPVNVNKVQMVVNKPQMPSVKPKKLIESTCNGHFEAVLEKLNELLDSEGGISKRKDAPKGYLKLLLLTAASGASRNGEAIQSNRELSVILDALLKTRSRVVLMDIINKNGLRMLHNIMKQYRRDFKKIPILRKLLKVLEYLAVRGILTLEHINGGPPCPGMESFIESMLSLTEHNDKQVHQIARSFRDRWIPRHARRYSYIDRDRMEFHRGSNCNRVSASQNHWHDQGVRLTEAPNCTSESNLATTSLGSAVHEGSSATCIGSGTKIRKRKSRWDQPADGITSSKSPQHSELKIESVLLQQSESNPSLQISKEVPHHVDRAGEEYSYCPRCVYNYRRHDEASGVDSGGWNIHDDVPPGFSSPINPALSPNASSTVADLPHQNAVEFPVDVVVGLPQRKFISRLPVSYGIPLPIVQQFGSPLAEAVDSWVIAPSLPFHPFPPLPPPPSCDEGTSPPCAVSFMEIEDTTDRGQQDSGDPAGCPSEDSRSTTGATQPDMDCPGPNDHRACKRARGSCDLGRRYFRQQKWNKGHPWVCNKNGWGCLGNNSRGGICSSDFGSLTNEHRTSYI